MRRSESMGPMRVQNDDHHGRVVRGKRSSSGTRNSGRSSSEGRPSVGIGRSSMGRPSTGVTPRSRTSTGYNSTGYPSLGRPSTSSSIPTYGGGAARPLSRLSSIGQKNPRHSSIGGRGRSAVPKECRPISDKAFQHKCIRRLSEFLIERGYPCSISNKGLQSPTNKEFYKIFEFIYSFMVPDIKINKPDEDIPRIFKLLGYPAVISKSSMFAVGSPHTWPGLLAALVWLMELVQFYLLNQESGDDRYLFTCDDDFDAMSEDKMLYLYVEKTYSAYLSGEDNFDKYDVALSRAIKAKYCGGSTATDPLSEINRLQQELDLLEQDSDILRNLKEQKGLLESDCQRMANYFDQVENFLKGLEHQRKETVEELEELVGKKTALEEKYKNMQNICEKQLMTQADIHRIQLKRRELQNQIDNLEKESESLDKDVWKSETDVARSREKIEGISREFNSKAHTLKLIPTTAENAQGIDYEMKTSHYSTMNDDHETLRSALLDFKKRCSAAVRDRESEKLKQTNHIEMLKESVNVGEEENNFLEKNVKKKEEEIERVKKMNQREYEMLQEEIDSEENIILELQKQCHISIQEAQRDLRDTLKNLELFVGSSFKVNIKNMLFDIIGCFYHRCDEKKLENDKILRTAIHTLNELVDEVVTGMSKEQEQLDDHILYSEGILKQLLAEEQEQIKRMEKDREEMMNREKSRMS
ncbi:hypothetical protein LOTGIDRAFT_230707 [Lottia gigantea]|uniref:Kinetochore protein NDC80 n=1 Tax=Lottia gigantea TaxID=225164 RepID=V4CH67_LOTGI|nr:hypothetical protein LOTGIDRAFT_230707 [Lottia gigantea]ESP01445.1 hypothetical protein LOTGIDRAFT_230707 [Lottia gigantea]